MVLSPGAASAVDITVLAGMGVVSGVRDSRTRLRARHRHKAIVSFEAGPLLMQKVNAGAPADLVTHYPDVIDDLIKQGKVVGSRVDFARAGVAVKASRSRRARLHAAGQHRSCRHGSGGGHAAPGHRVPRGGRARRLGWCRRGRRGQSAGHTIDVGNRQFA